MSELKKKLAEANEANNSKMAELLSSSRRRTGRHGGGGGGGGGGGLSSDLGLPEDTRVPYIIQEVVVDDDENENVEFDEFDDFDDEEGEEGEEGDEGDEVMDADLMDLQNSLDEMDENVPAGKNASVEAEEETRMLNKELQRMQFKMMSTDPGP